MEEEESLKFGQDIDELYEGRLYAYEKFMEILEEIYLKKDNINYLFHKKYITEPKLMDAYYDMEVDHDLYKKNILHSTFIVTSFSSIKKIVDKKKKYLAMQFLNSKTGKDIPKNQDIIDKYEDYLKNIENTINYSNIYIEESKFRRVGFSLDLLNELNYIEVIENNIPFIINLLSTGLSSLIIVDNTRSNINLEFEVCFTEDRKISFLVKIMSLENLVFETRNNLYCENIISEVLNSETYKTQSKSLDQARNKTIIIRYIKNSLNVLQRDMIKFNIKNKYYDINNIFKNSYFIFKCNSNNLNYIPDLTWTDIVEFFKKNKINLSGGLNRDKGMLSIIEFKLMNFINYVFNSNYISEEEKYDIINNSLKSHQIRIKMKDRITLENTHDGYVNNRSYMDYISWYNNRPKKNDINFSYPKEGSSLTLRIEPWLNVEELNNNNFQMDNKKLRILLLTKEGELEIKKEELSNNKRNLDLREIIYPKINFLANNNKHLSYFRKLSLNNIYGINTVRKYSTYNPIKDFNGITNIEILDDNNLSDIDITNVYTEIINNKNLSKEQKQLNMESLYYDISSDEQKDINFIKKNMPYKSNYKIIKSMETLRLKYEDKTLEKKFPKIFKLLNQSECLLITYSLIFILNARRINGWTKVSEIIGRKILYHLYYKTIKKNLNIQNISNINDIYIAQKNYSFDKFIEECEIVDINLDAIKIGDFFLEIFSHEPHIIIERVLGYKTDEESYIQKTGFIFKIADDVIEELSDNIFIDPDSIPMICKPKLWSKDLRGGNLLESFSNKSIFTGNINHGHDMKNLQILYDTINFLNRMEFEINNDLLKFIFTEKGKLLLNDIIFNNTDKSFILQSKTTIKLAELFRDETFFLPVKSDFRGRLYINSFYLNYQGSDFSRAFINFNEGCKLTEKGKYYLYIYGANLYNHKSINKESYEKRYN